MENSDLRLEIVKTAPESLGIEKSSGLFHKIARKCVKFLEWYLGSSVFVGVPVYLQNLNNDLIKAIPVADSLKSLEILSKISKGKRFPDEPFLYQYFTRAEKGNIGAGGVSFFKEEEAFWRAIAETAERYFWAKGDHFYKDKMILGSYSELKNSAIDIFSIAGFSDEQRKEHLNLKFNESDVFNWTPVKSLITGALILCPVQLASRDYFGKNVKTNFQKNRPEQMLRWCVTTGLATGRFLEEAIAKGILEIIERDAFMITYLNKLSPPIIDLDYLASQDKEIEEIIYNFKRYELEAFAIQMPTDFNVSAIMAVILDKTCRGPAIAVGASADFDLKTSVVDALSEALAVRFDLKNKDRYLESIDGKDIGREERLIYWGRPENLHKIDFLMNGEKVKIDLPRNLYEKKKDQEFYRMKFKELKEELRNKKYEAVYVEMSAKEVADIGLVSAYVIIPEMQPLHLVEALPYFGGKRLKEIPGLLGYKPAEELNILPHPFP